MPKARVFKTPESHHRSAILLLLVEQPGTLNGLEMPTCPPQRAKKNCCRVCASLSVNQEAARRFRA